MQESAELEMSERIGYADAVSTYVAEAESSVLELEPISPTWLCKAADVDPEPTMMPAHPEEERIDADADTVAPRLFNVRSTHLHMLLRPAASTLVRWHACDGLVTACSMQGRRKRVAVIAAAAMLLAAGAGAATAFREQISALLRLGVYNSLHASLAAHSFLMHEQTMRLFCM